MTVKLSEIEKAAEGATPGPWASRITGDAISGPTAVVVEDAQGKRVATLDLGDTEHSLAEWIAASREAVPALTAALRDVLALHYSEPYAQGPDHCAECEHKYPCPTVRAITAHVDLS